MFDRLNRADACGGEYVPLVDVGGGNSRECVVGEPNLSPGDRPALAVRLLAHVDHLGIPLVVDVCELLCHAPP